VERNRAASLGIREFFAKPVEADKLVETLDTYLSPLPEGEGAKKEALP
jgi:hypothetical protein